MARLRCHGCDSTITSKHVHDFVTCRCGQVSIDGGEDYTKISGGHYFGYSIFGDDDLAEVVHKGLYVPKDFQVGNFHWMPGDEYNHRAWKALNIIDKEAARRYYFTTHS